MDIENTRKIKELLKSLIYENEELEKLESIVEDFNIFTALRIENVEIRHSNFLSWLMDPIESHGLGGYFLKLFLKRIAYKVSSFDINGPSIFDIDSWEFADSEITREYKGIDILIRNER